MTDLSHISYELIFDTASNSMTKRLQQQQSLQINRQGKNSRRPEIVLYLLLQRRSAAKNSRSARAWAPPASMQRGRACTHPSVGDTPMAAAPVFGHRRSCWGAPMAASGRPPRPSEPATNRQGKSDLEDQKSSLKLLSGAGKLEDERRRGARVRNRRPEWEETGSIPSISGFPASVAQGGRRYRHGGAPGMLGKDWGGATAPSPCADAAAGGEGDGLVFGVGAAPSSRKRVIREAQ